MYSNLSSDNPVCSSRQFFKFEFRLKVCSKHEVYIYMYTKSIQVMCIDTYNVGSNSVDEGSRQKGPGRPISKPIVKPDHESGNERKVW